MENKDKGKTYHEVVNKRLTVKVEIPVVKKKGTPKTYHEQAKKISFVPAMDELGNYRLDKKIIEESKDE